MKKFVVAAFAAASIAAPLAANAATGNVIFNGNVDATCLIQVGAPGTLAASTDFQTLTGTGGSATLTVNGAGLDISVDAPTLTKPAADTTADTLAASFSTSGATSVSGDDTSAGQALSVGVTNVSVGMTANKSGADVYQAGSYTGTVVLRCE